MYPAHILPDQHRTHPLTSRSAQSLNSPSPFLPDQHSPSSFHRPASTEANYHVGQCTYILYKDSDSQHTPNTIPTATPSLPTLSRAPQHISPTSPAARWLVWPSTTHRPHLLDTTPRASISALRIRNASLSGKLYMHGIDCAIVIVH